MMELQEVIASLPGWETKTASQLVGLLNAPSVVVVATERDTWAEVAKDIGSRYTENLKLLMEANSLSWAVLQLAGKGLLLSHPEVQQFLSEFEDANVPGASVLKKKGVRNYSPLEHAELPPATLSEVEEAVALLNLQATKQAMEDDALNRLQVYREALSSWDGSGDVPVL